VKIICVPFPVRAEQISSGVLENKNTVLIYYIYALYFLIKQIFHLELLMSVCPHSIRLTLGVDGNGDGEWWVSPISAAHRGRPLTPAQ